MRKLIQLVESLAQEAGSLASRHAENEKEKAVADDNMRRLISAGNEFLHGNGDVLDFIGKLSSVLSFVQVLSSRELSAKSAKSGRCLEVGESKASSSLGGSDGDAEYNSYSTLQDDNAKLKAEKASMEQELQVANEKIERLKQQLSDSEQMVSNLRIQLSSMEASKQLAENELAVMASVKAELESKVRASCVEMGRLQENIAALESELQAQRQRHEEASKVQFPTGAPRSPRPFTEEAARMQGKEIAAAAEKLADCQRTIIALGKQLHSLSVPSGSSRGSMDFSDASGSPADPLQHTHQPFSLKTELVQSESEDDSSEHHSWKVQRSVSDMTRMRTARENIRKQEIYWSSALSPEPVLENTQPASSERGSSRKPSQDGEFFTNSPAEERSSSGSKHSGFSRFFHRKASLH